VIPARIYRIDRSHQQGPNKAGCTGTGGGRLEPPDHKERLLAHEARVAADLVRIEEGHEQARQGVRESRPRDNAEHPFTLLARKRRQQVALLLAAAGGTMHRTVLRAACGLERKAFARTVRHPWFRLHGGGMGCPRGWVELTPEGWATVASPDTGG
jgi:hypothetical protein